MQVVYWVLKPTGIQSVGIKTCTEAKITVDFSKLSILRPENKLEKGGSILYSLGTMDV